MKTTEADEDDAQECKVSGRTFIRGRPSLEIVRFVHGQCLTQSAIIVTIQRLQNA